MARTEARAEILENTETAPEVFRLRLQAPAIARDAAPGQFVMVRCSESTAPLLRRPFSIHDVFGPDVFGENAAGEGESGIVLLYRAVGEGTRLLSAKRAGEFVDVLGPLGRGFGPFKENSRALLVAGGMGVAPFVFLARRRSAQAEITLLLGARTWRDALCLEDFAGMGVPARTATEDGSLGAKGLVTDLLGEAFRTGAPDVVCACGPAPMLKAVAALCLQEGVACEVSLEAAMACGIGVCLGCAVAKRPDGQGYYHVCADGPVMRAEDLYASGRLAAL